VNSNPNRPGQNQGAGDPRALMLDLFAGEVITAFESATLMTDKHQTKTLSKGRSFKFPAIWRAGGGYHTPGTEITGRQIKHAELTIDPDDKLVSDVFVADIDEIMNHYEVRAPYTTAMGEFLARHYDANVMRAIIKAARGGALFVGDQGGSAIVDAALANDGTKLLDAVAASKQVLDEKDVPINSQPIHALFKAAQWYLMSRSDKNLNRDFNGGSSTIRQMTLETIDGIRIHKSNLTPFGEDTVATPATADGVDVPAYYRGKFGTTVGSVWTPFAAASAIVQDVGFEIVNQPEKQGTLMLARMMKGTRTLRNKCAVELRTGAIPA
jgi:hypothetical protein